MCVTLNDNPSHNNPDQDDIKKTHVEKEMIKLRQRNFRFFSRYLLHVAFVLCCYFFYATAAAPGLDNATFLIVSAVCYMQHLLVSKDWIAVTPELLKHSTWLMHIMGLSLIMVPAAGSAFKFGLLQAFLTAVRFLLVLYYLDPWVCIPFQILYTGAGMLIQVYTCEGFATDFGVFCVSHLFVLLIIVASSVFINIALRSRIYAQLDTTDAESLVSSFRRVLKGACDGEVLLDSHMNVAQESECLKHLILTDVNLKGRSFKHLLADEEQDRFAEFIESSTQAFGMPESADVAPPFCSRVAFRGSAGIGVAADIYHVPVRLFGAKDPYHLIAFKEDPESRPFPQAEGTVPLELKGQGDQKRPFQCGDPSTISGSTEYSNSNSHTCPELQEMTLLVDVNTELQDVQEAHLRFLRCDEPADLASALQSSMPSLRKLVKPTEWERVRSSATRFAESALRNPSIQPKVMKKMTIQLPGQSRVIAAEASLKRFPDALKVWLHLKGLRPEKPRRQPPLDGIQETGIRAQLKERFRDFVQSCFRWISIGSVGKIPGLLILPALTSHESGQCLFVSSTSCWVLGARHPSTARTAQRHIASLSSCFAVEDRQLEQ